MSDKSIAAVGRRLAEALSDFAYTRKDEDKKLVAALQSELCQTLRNEIAEAAEEAAKKGGA